LNRETAKPLIARGTTILLPQIEFITPVLNVSNVVESLKWFEQIGWKRTFTWNHAGMIEDKADRDDNGDADFAGVGSGKVQIFLCLDAQGSRGGLSPMFVNTSGDETGGCWISLWVAKTSDLDALHRAAIENSMNVILGITDQPWGSREFRLLHPDGHTLRINAVL